MHAFLGFLFSTLVVFAAPASAQSDLDKHPAQCPKGKSRDDQGSIAGDQNVEHTLRAAAGETMNAKLSGRSSAFHNVSPLGSTGEALPIGSRDGNKSTTELSAPDDDTTRVHQMGNVASSGKRLSFTLDVAMAGVAPQAVAAGAPGWRAPKDRTLIW